MLKVYKYPIRIDDYFEVELPEKSKILKVECQDAMPYMWALVDPLSPNKVRKFRFAGTGHPIKESMDNLNFISTFQMEGGILIFHIFEIKN